MWRVSRKGKITLRQENVSLAAAIEAAIETVAPALTKKAHTLTTEMPDESLYVIGDGVRIAQVLGNILSNAVKYTPQGGEILIDVRKSDEDVQITVRDNGVGMSAETIPIIFDLFVQSQNSLERSEGGLGIGLPLARTLVELHGGHIQAFSAGRGTAASSSCACRSHARHSLPSRLRAARCGCRAAGRRARLCACLLVDDSVDAATLLSMVLEADGYDVARCARGDACA